MPPLEVEKPGFYFAAVEMQRKKSADPSPAHIPFFENLPDGLCHTDRPKNN
jgi:hypothetical protein